MLFINVVPERRIKNLSNREITLNEIDPYVVKISNTIISLHRPSYFEMRIDDNSTYVNFLKNDSKRIGMIKFQLDSNTLRFEEDCEVDIYGL
jgi:hypothetical protein